MLFDAVAGSKQTQDISEPKRLHSWRTMERGNGTAAGFVPQAEAGRNSWTVSWLILQLLGWKMQWRYHSSMSVSTRSSNYACMASHGCKSRMNSNETACLTCLQVSSGIVYPRGQRLLKTIYFLLSTQLLHAPCCGMEFVSEWSVASVRAWSLSVVTERPSAPRQKIIAAQLHNHTASPQC